MPPASWTEISDSTHPNQGQMPRKEGIVSPCASCYTAHTDAPSANVGGSLSRSSPSSGQRLGGSAALAFNLSPADVVDLMSCCYMSDPPSCLPLRSITGPVQLDDGWFAS